MKYTFILQSKQRYGAMYTFFSAIFFFSFSTLLFELIGQCLMFTAFDCALQMSASACNRTHIRTLLNCCTHWKPFRIHRHQTALMTFVSEIALVFRVQQHFFPFLLSLFDVLLCNFCSINWNWQKRNVSLDLDQYTAWKMNVSTPKQRGKTMVWVCACVTYACVCGFWFHYS